MKVRESASSGKATATLVEPVRSLAGVIGQGAWALGSQGTWESPSSPDGAVRPSEGNGARPEGRRKVGALRSTAEGGEPTRRDLDEPEVHIHIADQAKFLEMLIGLGSDNQWIVATGSSEIMKTVRRDQMIVLPFAHDAPGVQYGSRVCLRSP